MMQIAPLPGKIRLNCKNKGKDKGKQITRTYQGKSTMWLMFSFLVDFLVFVSVRIMGNDLGRSSGRQKKINLYICS